MKFYCENITEQRPDTRLIEAKLRQYFLITGQRYDPLKTDNPMVVSLPGLKMLARSTQELDAMRWQLFTLCRLVVVNITTNGKGYVTHPFTTPRRGSSRLRRRRL